MKINVDLIILYGNISSHNKRKGEMNKGKTIQSVERACDILEAIARENEIGVTELSRSLGLHVATVHNLIRTLTARNYLINTNGRYRLGPAIPSLSSQWDPAMSLPGLLKPYVEDIARKTGEAAVATILTGSRAEMIVIIPGTQDITVQFRQKIWADPLSLATGRILVAFQPGAVRDEFIRRHMAEDGGDNDPQQRSSKDWQRELDHIAAEKTAIIRRSGLNAQSSFAAAVWGVGKQSVIAALGVSCPNFRLTKEHFACLHQAVQEAAGRASQLFQRKDDRKMSVGKTKYEGKKTDHENKNNKC